jgi:hypothetical protein
MSYPIAAVDFDNRQPGGLHRRGAVYDTTRNKTQRGTDDETAISGRAMQPAFQSATPLLIPYTNAEPDRNYFSLVKNASSAALNLSGYSRNII